MDGLRVHSPPQVGKLGKEGQWSSECGAPDQGHLRESVCQSKQVVATPVDSDTGRRHSAHKKLVSALDPGGGSVHD